MLTQISRLWMDSHKPIFRNIFKVKHLTWSVQRMLEVKATSGKGFLVRTIFCFGTPVHPWGEIFRKKLRIFEPIFKKYVLNFSNIVTWQRAGVPEQTFVKRRYPFPDVALKISYLGLPAGHSLQSTLLVFNRTLAPRCTVMDNPIDFRAPPFM